jgi:hypothetical protein
MGLYGLNEATKGNEIIDMPSDVNVPSNKGMEPTPRRGDQDRGYFEIWLWLDRFPDLLGRRGSSPSR